MEPAQADGEPAAPKAEAAAGNGDWSTLEHGIEMAVSAHNQQEQEQEQEHDHFEHQGSKGSGTQEHDKNPTPTSHVRKSRSSLSHLVEEKHKEFVDLSILDQNH